MYIRISKLSDYKILNDVYYVANDRLNKVIKALERYNFCFKLSGTIAYVKAVINKDAELVGSHYDKESVDVESLIDKVVSCVN